MLLNAYSTYSRTNQQKNKNKFDHLNPVYQNPANATQHIFIIYKLF